MANVPGEKRKKSGNSRSAVMTIVVLAIGMIVGVESFNITYRYMLKDEEDTTQEESFSANSLLDWFQNNSVNTEIDGMVRDVDNEEKQITILNMNNDSDIVLAVNSDTKYPQRISDETGATVEMGLGDFSAGDFVTFVYDKNKALTDIKMCELKDEDTDEGYWEYSSTGCTVVEKSKLINFFGADSSQDKSYNYDKANIVVTYGNTRLSMADVSSLDFITVKGYTSGNKKRVYAVNITRGHGQLVFQSFSSILEGKLHIESISGAEQAAEAATGDTAENTSYDADDTFTYTADFDLAEKNTYDLVEGRYRIKITSKNCVDFEQDINISPTSPCSIDLSKIEVKKGNLSVTVNVDDFRLFIDDKPAEEGEKFRLEYGQHKVTVTKAGYTTYSENVSLYSEEMTVPVDLEVKPKLGTIDITVSPSNASVYIDGKKVGTGSMKTDVKIGTHSVTAKAEGYSSGGRNVTVNSEGEVVDCGIVLERTKRTEKETVKKTVPASQPQNNAESAKQQNADDSQTPPDSGTGGTSAAPAGTDNTANPPEQPEIGDAEQPEAVEHDPVEDILVNENSVNEDNVNEDNAGDDAGTQ